MKPNEGKKDRIIRLLLGLIVLALSYIYLQGNWQIAGYIIGAITLITGLTGFCGLYALLKISTLDK